MKRFLLGVVLLGLVVAAGVLWLTRPQHIAPERFANLSGDAANGETVYFAGGCASCHKAEGSEDALSLPGGRRFTTPFGTFVAPNISSDAATGIGDWTVVQFASALLNGTSPEGRHYFPAFPYTTYARMTDQDVVDLWAFMQTLPAEDRANEPHDIGFPFNIRLSLGPWKVLFLDRDWVQPADTPELQRGRYLVEALGHCAECHTPRNILGGAKTASWMGGAPNPSGKGKIPDITPKSFDWSATDIAYYLESGFTPEFDSAGGEMAEVVANMARLSPEDRAAIAAYVKALPAAN
ncbi:MAG: c-type cytochrome [Silicimonas sp.]|nr:c-type cytochrome [Silicimonas sp.]